MTIKRIIIISVVCIICMGQVVSAGMRQNHALVSAIHRDDVEGVKTALEKGADVNARTMRGKPITIAEKKGNQEIIQLLIESGAEPSEKKAAPPTSPAQPEPVTKASPSPDMVDTEVSKKETAKPVSASDTPAKADKPVRAKPVTVEPEKEVVAFGPASESVVKEAETIVQSGKLQTYYNAIVVDYLIEEGRDRLPAPLTKQALDQLVAALMEKTNVSKDKQLEMALGTLAGIAMGAAGNDVVSGAGADVEGAYAGEWADWIDSAFNLIHAGYQEDAAKFFEFGIVHIPYSSLKARCVKGLALARPEQAYDYLMEQANGSDPAYVQVALPLLGILGSDPNIAADQKQAILDILEKKTAVMAGPDVQLAAVYGMRNINDPVVKDILMKFTSGLTVDKWVKREALRTLLLTYDDESVASTLSKMANAGSFSMTDDSEKVFAGLLLIEDQQPDGYTWAKKKLTPKRKNFFAPDDKGPDPRADIVTTLVRYGGDKGKNVLSDVIDKYKDKDWLKTWIATGLLEFGDTTYIALVKSSLNNPEWDFTAVRIVEALAKNGDYSGLSVLQQLIEKRPPKKSSAMKIMGALAGQADDTKAKEQRLARLRIQVGDALARINQDDCVPLLELLLNDQDKYVRSNAALALTRMTKVSALNGMVKAMNVDYGIANEESRNPNIQAHIVRMASMRYPSDSTTKEIQKMGASSAYPSVAFLSVVSQ